MSESPTSLAAPADVRICLLNSPRLSPADGQERVLERKDAALIAMLAQDGPTQRARIATCLWPSVSERQARTNLRQRLFRLRQQAGGDIVRDDGALRLADNIGLDVIESLRALTTDPAAAAGELLGAHDYGEHEELERWVASARERWRSQRTKRIEERAGELEAQHDFAAALPYAQRLVDEEPLREQAHRRLIRLHYLRGDRAAAMAAFGCCREYLLSELGVEPDEETLQLARLVESGGASAPPRPVPRPIGVLRPPRLIGREAQWQRLQAIADAPGGALILGEAGIGKSRLLSEVAATRCALACSARPGDAALPFAFLARLVRAAVQAFGPVQTDWARLELARIVPEIGDAPAGSPDVLRLHQALLQTLRHARKAGLSVVAVDDLHFADAASLELLPALLAEGREMRLAWLLASRTGDSSRELQGLHGDESAGIEQVRLGPLEAHSVQVLLESLAIPGFDAAAWAPSLTRHTGGNPMFLLETLIALLDRDAGTLAAPPRDLPVPAQIGELIERRLRQLHPDALKLARLAALAGPDFSVDLAAEVLAKHPLEIADDWRELESALVIRDNAFAHDLIFEATLRSVPAAIARDLHARIAERLERRGVEARRVAAHWQAAGHSLDAGRQFRAAAKAALAAGLRREEAEALRCAAEAFAECGQHDDRFEALCDRVGALVQSAGSDAANSAASELLELARTEYQRLRASVALSEVQIVRGDFAAVACAMPEALRAAESNGNAELAVLAARRLAVALVNTGRGDEACEILLSRLANAERSLDVHGQGEFMGELGTVLERSDRRAQGRLFQTRGIDLALQCGDLSTAVTGLANLAISQFYAGELPDAVDCIERGMRLRRDDASGQGLGAGIEMSHANMLRDLGRYREALPTLERVLAAFRDEGNELWSANVEAHLALLWIALGQNARAQALVAKAAPAGVPPFIAARRLTVAAQLLRIQGRAAHRPLEEATRLLEGADRADVRLILQMERSLQLDPASAVDLCASTVAESERRELHGLRVGATLRWIEAALRNGDVQSAAHLAQGVAEELPRLTPPGFYLPEGWWIVQGALDAADDRRAADFALRRAADWIRGTALPNVPDEFRDGFLHRNPINRAVLAAASRQLRTTDS